MLVEVQNVLNLLAAKTNVTVPWSTAVPGASYNYSTIDSARRMKHSTTMKTGKNDATKIGQVVNVGGT